MKQFDYAYQNSRNLLCTEHCPCNLAINKGKAQTLNLTVNENGAYNVFKCQHHEKQGTDKESEQEMSYHFENTMTLKLKYIEEH